MAAAAAAVRDVGGLEEERACCWGFVGGTVVAPAAAARPALLGLESFGFLLVDLDLEGGVFLRRAALRTRRDG